MPLYDYTCSSCGHRFEATNTIDNRATAACPECNGTGEQRISPVNFDVSGMGLDPAGFPTFADKWAKRHEKAARDAKKKEAG